RPPSSPFFPYTTLFRSLPLIPVNHLAGHIYANQLIEPLEFPLLALVVSGGHTELIYMKEHGAFEIIGETHDDAAGEAYDKIGRRSEEHTSELQSRFDLV